MDIIASGSLFGLSIALIWFFSGVIIDAVSRIAKHLHRNGFVVAFFILGFLTSISEISVAINSTVQNIPQVSVGNLVGASFVVIMFLVPLLAIAGKGIRLKHTLAERHLGYALMVAFLPVLLVMDGSVDKVDGVIALCAYLFLLYFIRLQSVRVTHDEVDVGHLPETASILPRRTTALLGDFAQIVAGAVVIFYAGKILVEQTVFFAKLVSVPESLIGLLILSIGTNVPELMIAIRAIFAHRKGIAFGDYLGSVIVNTPTFAFLALANDTFLVERGEFVGTAILTAIGFAVFYVFSRSKHDVSRREGVILLSFYVLFLLVQIVNIVRLTN